MALFSEIADNKCIKDRYPALDSENSNCAKLRGHVSSIVEFLFVLLVKLTALLGSSANHFLHRPFPFLAD